MSEEEVQEQEEVQEEQPVVEEAPKPVYKKPKVEAKEPLEMMYRKGDKVELYGEEYTVAKSMGADLYLKRDIK